MQILKEKYISHVRMANRVASDMYRLWVIFAIVNLNFYLFNNYSIPLSRCLMSQKLARSFTDLVRVCKCLARTCLLNCLLSSRWIVCVTQEGRTRRSRGTTRRVRWARWSNATFATRGTHSTISTRTSGSSSPTGTTDTRVRCSRSSSSPSPSLLLLFFSPALTPYSSWIPLLNAHSSAKLTIAMREWMFAAWANSCSPVNSAGSLAHVMSSRALRAEKYPILGRVLPDAGEAAAASSAEPRTAPAAPTPTPTPPPSAAQSTWVAREPASVCVSRGAPLVTADCWSAEWATTSILVMCLDVALPSQVRSSTIVAWMWFVNRARSEPLPLLFLPSHTSTCIPVRSLCGCQFGLCAARSICSSEQQQ